MAYIENAFAGDQCDLYRRVCYNEDSRGARHVAFGRINYDYLLCNDKLCGSAKREVDTEYDNDDYPSTTSAETLRSCPSGYNNLKWSYQAPLPKYIICTNTIVPFTTGGISAYERNGNDIITCFQHSDCGDGYECNYYKGGSATLGHVDHGSKRCCKNT